MHNMRKTRSFSDLSLQWFLQIQIFIDVERSSSIQHKMQDQRSSATYYYITYWFLASWTSSYASQNILFCSVFRHYVPPFCSTILFRRFIFRKFRKCISGTIVALVCCEAVYSDRLNQGLGLKVVHIPTHKIKYFDIPQILREPSSRDISVTFLNMR